MFKRCFISCLQPSLYACVRLASSCHVHLHVHAHGHGRGRGGRGARGVHDVHDAHAHAHGDDLHDGRDLHDGHDGHGGRDARVPHDDRVDRDDQGHALARSCEIRVCHSHGRPHHESQYSGGLHDALPHGVRHVLRKQKKVSDKSREGAGKRVLYGRNT